MQEILTKIMPNVFTKPADLYNSFLQTLYMMFASGIVSFLFGLILGVILIVTLIPLTRAIMGSAIGTKGALLPLVFGTVPFFTRQIESALAEVDKGLIEAAESMGSSPTEIIFRVYLRESFPGIIRATQITFISLIGLTAMAGAIGGGGLGDYAIRYGHQRGQTDVTYITVLIILLMVSLIQGIGSLLIKRTTH